jgi:hypothetical protein
VRTGYAEAVRRFRKAAEQGMAGAQLILGGFYQFGRSVPQDYGEAARWFRKAADQGLADAQFQLGTFYQFGRGVPQDYGEAVRLYQKAADQGVAGAQNNIGFLYLNGLGMARDYAEAGRWFRKAADQGYAGAQFNLGSLYEEGLGVTRDEAQARAWITKAALAGNEEAKTWLAQHPGLAANEKELATSGNKTTHEASTAEAQFTFKQNIRQLEDAKLAFENYQNHALSDCVIHGRGENVLEKCNVPENGPIALGAIFFLLDDWNSQWTRAHCTHSDAGRTCTWHGQSVSDTMPTHSDNPELNVTLAIIALETYNDKKTYLCLISPPTGISADQLEKCNVPTEGPIALGAIAVLGGNFATTSWGDTHCAPIVGGYKCEWRGQAVSFR